MVRKFASPEQFRGENIRPALIANWRSLVTHLNRFVPWLESDGTSLLLPGDVSVAGNLDVTGNADVGGDLDVVGTLSAPGAPYALIAMATHTDTADYLNVPASATITHTKTVAVGAAARQVYVDVSISVRWKGMTVGSSYIYARPSVNGVVQGLINVENSDVTGYKTLTQRVAGAFTADGSGNIVLGTACYASGGTADVEEVQIVYAIWAR